jgi:serine/threonine protein phosphatase PrpC
VLAMFSKTEPPKTIIKKTGKFISASVKGANHADRGIICQDAASSATLYHKGYKFYFMAVADGHGAITYTRSDIGSFLAMQAASESINRFIMYVIDVYEKFPDNWVSMVKDDFSIRFGKMLVNNWVRMVEAHANETTNDTDAIIKLYGTTVSVALVFNNHLFTGRIGDSSVFAVVDQNKKIETKDLFEAYDDENASPDLSTASLCSREAYRKWQMQVLPLDDIKMLLLATDGFMDSLDDPKGTVMEYYRYITKKGFINIELFNGFVNFEQIIDKELQLITKTGVGDDISLVIFLPD